MKLSAKHIIICMAAIMVLTAAPAVYAQRKASPVTEPKTHIGTVERKRAAQQLIDKKVRPSLIFSDSLINVEEFTRKDTAKGPVNVYPKLYNLAFGVNIWDPIMRALGQKYGLIDVSGEISFYNRYQAILELGLGQANNTPEDMNFTYRTPLSFYGKVGASYNFTYNGNPDYRFTGGLMLGFSAFKYSITDVHVQSDYWHQSGTFNIDNLSAHALWSELRFGLRVKIVKQIYAGWNFRYRFMLGCKKNEQGSPWYIPGLGPRTQAIGANFSIYYVLPLTKKAAADIVVPGYENDMPVYTPAENPENGIPLNP